MSRASGSALQAFHPSNPAILHRRRTGGFASQRYGWFASYRMFCMAMAIFTTHRGLSSTISYERPAHGRTSRVLIDTWACWLEENLLTPLTRRDTLSGDSRGTAGGRAKIGQCPGIIADGTGRLKQGLAWLGYQHLTISAIDRHNGTSRLRNQRTGRQTHAFSQARRDHR
jgi:hypothetical protein